MDTLTPQDAAIAGGLVGPVLVFGLIFYILMVVAAWKIFTKAGIAGWKSLIPIYNNYLLYKLSGIKNWFWIVFVVSIISGLIWGGSGLDMNMTTEQAQAIDWGNYIPAVISMIVLCIINLIASILLASRLAKAFRKGTGFAVGLFFLPNIFQLILAFGSAKYDKKVLKDV